MRWLIWSILLFAVAVAVALLARVNIGNVSILWPPYRIDASVNLVALILTLGFVFFHLFLIGIRRALELPGRVREYRERRRAQLATDALRDAVLAFFEGRFGRSERMAQTAQEVPALAGTAALVAARAAHRLQEFGRRDAWLNRVTDDARLQQALLMTRAELAVEERRAESAIEALTAMQAGGARHLYAQRVALRAYEQAGNWSAVLRTLRSLDKRDALHPTVSMRLRITAHTALFDAATDDLVSVRRSWNEVAERDRQVIPIADAAARAFVRAGDREASCRIIEAVLEQEWSSRLGAQYARIEGVAPRDRLARAEQWRARYPTESELLLLLGELCLLEKLWGKAREYLTQALRFAPGSAPIHGALARLHEALGESTQAAEHWRASAMASAESAHGTRGLGLSMSSPIGTQIGAQIGVKAAAPVAPPAIDA
jgi:HemY protein